jgi:hypothetical protein
MVGNVAFALAPPDGAAAVDPLVEPTHAGPPAGEQQAAVGGAPPDVPAPPRLPYAPDPGTYTQLWASQSATTTAGEMKTEMEAYVEAYTDANPDYNAIQTAILNSADWMGFLTVIAGNQVVLVHSLGLYSSGLGRPTAAHNRIFGLIGERVGTDLPPIVMVPSAGLVPWIKVQSRYQPHIDQINQLATGEARTILAPTVERDEDEMSVQNICFVPKAWAPYFLAPLSPWQALQTYDRLMETIPPNLKSGFNFLGSWISIACTHAPNETESILKAKWQNPPAERRMISWMQRRTLFVNDMPATTAAANPGFTLDPQECFNKALETVAALRPVSEAMAAKKYTQAELQRLRAACSLTVPEMETSLLLSPLGTH